jgi:hypothetical protein
MHPGQARIAGQVNGSCHPQRIGACLRRHRSEIIERTHIDDGVRRPPGTPHTVAATALQGQIRMRGGE